MNINRMVADFGNSLGQFMIDGHYFEMPSSIAEITEKDFQGMFAHTVPAESLMNHLVLKIAIEEGHLYFMAGKKAQADLLGNAHIHSLHDKTQSQTVWVTWLAAIALYHATKEPDMKEDTISIEYFGTLLPVWLVKKGSSFKEKLSVMSERFLSEVSFELVTMGFQRKLHLKIEQAQCKVEGENARHALKFDLEGNPKEDAMRFKDAFVVMDDIGGQSQDLCKLQPDLRGAQSADDFVSSTDQSYLAVLEKLRTDKLMDYFRDVRALEEFVLKHIATRKYLYLDPVKHAEHDLTDVIEPILADFAEVAMQKALQSFHFQQGDLVYYVHIGGVNQALREYMMAFLGGYLGEAVAKKYHLFPEDSRKLNIYACEIVAKNVLKRKVDVIKQKVDV
ncbi:hypothetical protein ABEW34_21420 [Paenibacillus algorifonticola]|uniref:Alp7A family actin-like protein n=1 Tax=Paenibacillus algorifonticola TaxID=684063 RepID=UPI003D28E0DF